MIGVRDFQQFVTEGIFETLFLPSGYGSDLINTTVLIECMSFQKYADSTVPC